MEAVEPGMEAGDGAEENTEATETSEDNTDASEGTESGTEAVEDTGAGTETSESVEPGDATVEDTEESTEAAEGTDGSKENEESTAADTETAEGEETSAADPEADGETDASEESEGVKYQTDEDGNLILDENGNPIPVEEEETEPEEEEPVEVNLTNKVGSVGIELHAEAGVLPNDVKMRARRVTITRSDNEESIGYKLWKVMEEDGFADSASVLAYDLTLIYEDEEIQPDGDVTVTLSGIDWTDVETAAVYHISDDNEIERVTDAAPEGDVVFQAGSFSVYALAMGKAAEPEVAVDLEAKAGSGTVSVHAEPGILPADAKMTVKPVSIPYSEKEGSLGQAFWEAVSTDGFQMYPDVVAYDITLKDGDGNEIHDLDGDVTVTYKGINWTGITRAFVYYVGEDNQIEQIASDIQPGEDVTFQTNHFSTYAVALDSGIMEIDNNDGDIAYFYIWKPDYSTETSESFQITWAYVGTGRVKELNDAQDYSVGVSWESVEEHIDQYPSTAYPRLTFEGNTYEYDPTGEGGPGKYVVEWDEVLVSNGANHGNTTIVPAATKTFHVNGHAVFPVKMDVKKEVTGATGEGGKAKPGDILNYTITIKNEGSGRISSARLTDIFNGSGLLQWESQSLPTDITLNGGETKIYKAIYKVSEEDKGKVLSNTVTVERSEYEKTSATVKTEVENPSLLLNKILTNSGTGAGGAFRAGETAKFDITVTNNGNTTQSNVTVTEGLADAKIVAGTGYTINESGQAVIGTIAPGATVTVKAAYTVTQEDIDSDTTLKNIALVKGDNGTEPDPTPEVPIPEEKKNPSLTSEKKITNNGTGKDGVFKAGETAEFDITVTNNGNTTQEKVTVAEQLANAKIVEGTGYTINDGKAVIEKMEPGATVTVKATYTVTQEDIDSEAELKNVALVDGDNGTDPDPEPEILIPEEKRESGLTATKTLTNSGTGDQGAFKVGETAEFDITVTNSGNTTQTNVIVTEKLAGATIIEGSGYTINEAGEAEIEKIEPGNSVTVKATYTVQAEDLGKGLLNIATVTGGEGVTPNPPPVQIPLVARNYSLVVTKTKSEEIMESNDGWLYIDYTVTVKNNGTLPLTNVQISDEKFGEGILVEEGITYKKEGDTLIFDALNADESIIIHYPYYLAEEDFEKGYVVNVVRAKAKEAGQRTASTYTELPVADYTVYKTVTGTNGENGNAKVGDNLLYTVKITNTGKASLHGYLTDIFSKPMVLDELKLDQEQSTLGCEQNGNAITIPKGGEAVLTAAYTVKDEDRGTTLKNTVSFTDSRGAKSENAFVETLVDDPKFTVKKSVQNEDTSAGAFCVGETIKYSIVIENTGNVTLNDLTVTDDKFGSKVEVTGDVTWKKNESSDGAKVESLMIFGLEPRESAVISYSYTVTEEDVKQEEDGNKGFVKNTVTVQKDSIQETDTVITETEEEPPSLKAEKKLTNKGTADNGSFKAGETAEFDILVTNNGNVTQSNVTVTEQLENAVIVAGEGYTINEAGQAIINNMAPDTQVVVKAEYTVTPEDIASGKELKNIAVISGEGTDPETPEVVIPTEKANPHLLVTKRIVGFGTDGYTLGSEITYKIIVRNTGNVALHNVTVTDDKVTLSGEKQKVETLSESTGEITSGEDGIHITVLNPGEEVTISDIKYIVTEEDIESGTIENIAIATGTTFQQETVTAKDSATAHTEAVNKHLTVTKTTTSTPKNGTAYALGETINYSIIVTNDGNLTVNDIKVMDELTGNVEDAAWTIESLKPGDQKTFVTSYIVSEEDIESGKVINVATAEADETEVEPGRTEDPTVAATPALGVEKTVTSGPANGTAYALGEKVTYNIVVKNTGNVTLNDVTVRDRVTGLSKEIGSLKPGASDESSTSYVITEDDIIKGSFTNTAYATGKDPNGKYVYADGAATVQTEAMNPKLSVTKRLVGTNTADLGEKLTFKIIVKNEGNVPLKDIAVTDELVWGNLAKYTIPLLKVGEEYEIKDLQYTVTEADILAGRIVNTAEAVGKAPNGDAVSGKDSVVAASADARGHLTVIKTVTGSPRNGSAYELGEKVAYEVTVINDGNVTIRDIKVIDELTGNEGGNALSVDSLMPGESKTFETSYEVVEDDLLAGKVVNVATATGKDHLDREVASTPGKAEAATQKPAPSLFVEKTANVSAGAKLNQEITYTITVTNNGNVTVKNVTVTDPLTDTSEVIGDMAPGAQKSVSVSYTVTEADILAGKINNTATATGTTPNDGKVIADASVEVRTEDAAPELSLEKYVRKTNTGYDVGDTVHFSIYVKNTGNVTLTNVTVTDELTAGKWLVGSLAPGERKKIDSETEDVCSAEYVVTADDIRAGGFKNTANATATAPDGKEQRATAEVSVYTAVPNGHVTLSKETNSIPKNGSAYALGETITYSITATNDGNLTLTDITVTDELTGDKWMIESLEPGDSRTFTASYTVTAKDIANGSVVNEVTGQTEDPDDPEVPVDPGTTEDKTEEAKPGLTVTKRVFGSNYGYNTGDQIRYRVIVENTGNVDLENVTVTDELTGDTWTIETLEQGGSRDFETKPYTVTDEDVIKGTAENVAEATGTAPDGTETEGSAKLSVETVEPNGHLTVEKTTLSTPSDGIGYALGESIVYSIKVVNDGNLTVKNITVTDELTGNTGENAWTIESLEPGASEVFTAVYVVTAEDILKGSVSNEATATGTSPDPDEPDVPVDPGRDDEPTAAPSPSLQVTKRIRGASGPYGAGDTITFGITVENTGNVPLDVVVEDEKTGNVGSNAVQLTDPLQPLQPGESRKTFVDYTVTEADILEGDIENVAVATGTVPGNDNLRTTAMDNAHASTVLKNGHLTVKKETTSRPANGSEYRCGETITYEVTVINDGNLTITDITVTDELTGDSWTVGSLAPGDSETFTASHMVTEDDILNGQYVKNVATAIGTSPDPDKPSVPVEPGETEDLIVPKNGHLTISKETTSTPQNGTTYALGETITYSVTATNDGNLTLTDITVTDELTGDEWTIESLEPGANETFTAEHVVTEEDVLAGSVKNVATAIGTSPDPNKPEVPVTPGVKEVPTMTQSPSIFVEKTADKTTGVMLGESVTYTITVTNNGNVTISDITVTDELTGNTDENAWKVESLAPGKQETFTASHIVTEDDILKGEITNTANAEGKAPNGATVKGTASVKVEPKDKSAHATITKTTTSTPKDGTAYGLGETITYVITVVNDGNLTLTNVVVKDELTKAEWTINSLAPGESRELRTSYVVLEKDIRNGKVVNVAAATGTSPDPEIKPTIEPGHTEDPTEKKNGHLTVTKTTTSTPGNTEAYVLGEKITYEITVTNDGNLTLANVVVTDELTGDEWTIPSLAPKASETFTAEYVVTEEDVLSGSVINEATATGISPDPEKPVVPVEPGEKEDPTEPKNGHLTIAKETTSNPENGETYALGETITYEITVTNDGNLSLTNVVVTDELTNSEWTINSMAPGESRKLLTSYKVKEKDIRAGSVVNEATARGTSPDPDQPAVPVDPGKTEDRTEPKNGHLTISKTTTSSPENGEAYVLGETITYSITATNDGNLTLTGITVTDELTGNVGENAWTIESLEPGASETFTAEHVVTEADVLAGSVKNVATATGTSPDSEKPEVPVDPGKKEDPTAPKNGHLTISKETTSTPQNGITYALGETITYSITATNDGNLTLTGITVTDELTGNVGENAWTIESLEPGASETFTAEYVVTEADVHAGSVKNEATATGTSPDPEKPEVPVVPGEKEVPVEKQGPSLNVIKTASKAEGAVLDEEIAYEIAVTNNGNVTIANITVSDPLTGLEEPIGTLEPGGQRTVTTNYTITAEDVEREQVVNTAVAVGMAPDNQEVTANGSATVRTTAATTPGGETPTPPGGETPTPPGGGETPTNPEGETPTNPGGGETPTNPEGETPTNPGGETPTNPGGETPTNPGGGTPTNPGGGTSIPSGNLTPVNPGSGSTAGSGAAGTTGTTDTTGTTGTTTSIPDGGVPLTSMPDNPVPLADMPMDELVTILDEDVPLSALPQTGDAGALGSLFGLLATLTGLGGALLMRRKEEDE